jgi:ABC-type sugar transport system substrate-binding protein
MSRLRITALAAALIAAASLTGATAVPAAAAAWPHAQILKITGHGFGTGATSEAAESAAVVDLHGNYSGCGPYTLIYDNKQANVWHAEVEASCNFAI